MSITKDNQEIFLDDFIEVLSDFTSYQFYRSTATWKITPEEIGEETEGWHYFRIQQNGANASGQTYYLSLSGFEIYGKVTSVIDQMKRKLCKRNFMF